MLNGLGKQYLVNMNMKNKILEILNSFGREEIHILGDIPDNKLQTAIEL